VVVAARARRAQALFPEPQLDAAAARVIAREAGLPLFELDPVGGSPAASTYEAWLRRNADVLDQALR
jgi:ABC-type Zn uptake system ZnuABC Zn-binding protein ZnuA